MTLQNSQSDQNVAVIIVTHNSEKHIDKCMSCLAAQTHPPAQVILIDSGSTKTDYLLSYCSKADIEVIFAKNDIGFCQGNNMGLSKLYPEIDFLFFLNPDAFIESTFIEKAVVYMQQDSHCGALTGTTEGYNIENDQPTGFYDSTGIFHTWWGHWYDRAQGKPTDQSLYQDIETIPAICGAIFFCRHSAAKQVMLPGGELFDNRFYMYKEDIDLSLRLREKGWKLMFVPELLAFHCRGWNRHRRSMPKKMRLHSAHNELRIHWRQKSLIPLLYSTMKYWAVKCFNI